MGAPGNQPPISTLDWLDCSIDRVVRDLTDIKKQCLEAGIDLQDYLYHERTREIFRANMMYAQAKDHLDENLGGICAALDKIAEAVRDATVSE